MVVAMIVRQLYHPTQQSSKEYNGIEATRMLIVVVDVLVVGMMDEDTQSNSEVIVRDNG